MRFARIRTPKYNEVGLIDLLIRASPASSSKNRRQTGDAWSVSSTVTAVDVVASDDHARELLGKEVQLVGRLGATEEAERVGPTCLFRGSESGGSPIQRLVPRGNTKPAILSYERLF